MDTDTVNLQSIEQGFKDTTMYSESSYVLVSLTIKKINSKSVAIYRFCKPAML